MDPETEEATDEDLTALVALPYLSWSDEETDPEKLGVTVWDKERAWSGLNLYTNDVNEAYLMDMAGRRLHTWTLPETPLGQQDARSRQSRDCLDL